MTVAVLMPHQFAPVVFAIIDFVVESEWSRFLVAANYSRSLGMTLPGRPPFVPPDKRHKRRRIIDIHWTGML